MVIRPQDHLVCCASNGNFEKHSIKQRLWLPTFQFTPTPGHESNHRPTTMQRRNITLILGALCASILLSALRWTAHPHEVSQHGARGSSQDLSRSDGDDFTSERIWTDVGSAGILEGRPPAGLYLNRRAPALTNPVLFNAAKKRGQQLICAMARPQNAPQSAFSKFEDLQTVSSPADLFVCRW